MGLGLGALGPALTASRRRATRDFNLEMRTRATGRGPKSSSKNGHGEECNGGRDEEAEEQQQQKEEDEEVREARKRRMRRMRRIAMPRGIHVCSKTRGGGGEEDIDEVYISAYEHSQTMGPLGAIGLQSS